MCMGGAPATPAPPPLPPAAPPPPTTVDPKVRAAHDATRQQAALAEGRGSTILTSPLGLTKKASTAQKTLLGG
jgi:hypothetical protein